MGLPSVTRTKKQATIQSYAHPRDIPGPAPSAAAQPDAPTYPDGLAAKATRQTKQHR